MRTFICITVFNSIFKLRLTGVMKGWRLLFYSSLVCLSDIGYAQTSRQADQPSSPTRLYQHKPNGHGFYIGGRIPRTYYLRSDLTLFGTVFQADGVPVDFDVTIENLQSVDEGSAFAAIHRSFTSSVQSPPYAAVIGYRFKNSIFGIAGRYLHYKQFMVSNQQNHIRGQVGNLMYSDYYGRAPFLLKYENTDGHNIICIGLEANIHLKRSANQKHEIGTFLMVGPGLAITRTDALVALPDGTLIGRNNDYKLSGGGVVIEMGLVSRHYRYFSLFLEGNLSVIRNANMFIIDDGVNRLRGSQTIAAVGWSFGFAFSVPDFVVNR